MKVKVFRNSLIHSSFARGVVRGNPGGEGIMAGPDRLKPAGIFNGCVNLQTVAHDAGVGKKSRSVLLPVSSDPVDIEAMVSALEGRALFEHQEPGQAGLIDLQHQAFKQDAVIVSGESIFPIVIGPMELVARSDAAVSGHALREL